MFEILKGKVCEKRFNPETRRIEVVKIYHIKYIDKVIYLDSPIKVKALKKIQELLKRNHIEYKNIIIGRPDI